MAHHHSPHDIRIARERADLARARFARRLKAMRERISPTRLKSDAGEAFLDRVDSAKAAARRAFWRRPVLTTSLVLGSATIILWRPLKQIGRSALEISRDVQKWHQHRQETYRNDD